MRRFRTNGGSVETLHWASVAAKNAVRGGGGAAGGGTGEQAEMADTETEIPISVAARAAMLALHSLPAAARISKILLAKASPIDGILGGSPERECCAASPPRATIDCNSS